ncbi:MAG TPA: VOC family protein [Nevskiaceae bacterium]|nr:VOC family protein [Nevskiaceae bacterium]
MKARIAPCLWFDRNAEEAAKFYCSIFPNSKIRSVSHYGDGMQLPKGTVLAVMFELDGQPVMGLNGGPLFTFSEAISLVVYCDTQKEIDHYWSKLTAGGGQEVQCGWLKDKFGLSWQVVPSGLERMLDGRDPARVQRVMDVVMKSVKLDLAAMEQACQ